MVLWDNWRMLHCVRPGPFEEVRIVERTTLGGDYGLGRTLERPVTAA
jgi:taurine dioxygenase